MSTPSRPLSLDSLARLGKALGSFSMDMAGGRIHVVNTWLPRGCPAAVYVRDGELFVVLDGGQPCARRHAWALICERGLDLLGLHELAKVLELIPVSRAARCRLKVIDEAS